MNKHQPRSTPAIGSSAKNRPIILASSSAYRKQQLRERLGITLTSVAPMTDETQLDKELAIDMCLRLSREKAGSIRISSPIKPLIIAGDQTAEFKGQLLRKPGDRDTAIAQLKSFSGEEIVFHSGVCLLDTADGVSHVNSVKTQVQFRSLTHDEIVYYVDRDKPFDCVGAFKNEALGIALFDSIESLDPSALTGLPLIYLCKMLKNCGFNVLTRSA